MSRQAVVRSIGGRMLFAGVFGGGLLVSAMLVNVAGAEDEIGLPLPTTVEDFFQPGSQPQPDAEVFAPVSQSSSCASCHGDYLLDSDDEPFDSWTASMMAQSARDPVWQAAVTIANQDAASSGSFCIRCHAPGVFLSSDGMIDSIDDLEEHQFDGINCNFCHRTLDHNYVKGVSPPGDDGILMALDFPPDPLHHGNARYVVDPVDSRRGPYDDVPQNFHAPTPIIPSAFHRSSDQCGQCHDVSNPAFTRNPKTGKLELNPVDTAHPTQDPHDMLPEQRTYSEWAQSQFASGGVLFDDGRFGGNHATGVMESCQDCHMPDRFAGGCFAWEFDPFFPREDLGYHAFLGANTWVLNAVFDKYGYDAQISPEKIADATARNEAFLRKASDMELEQCGDAMRVRITNWTGHKLPTGYPEGRRMWVNVQYFDSDDLLVQEHGHYDTVTADLTTSDTKVYEVKFGLDEDMAKTTGLPEGESFHLALNNQIEHDNRIPPVGFTNAGFEAVRAQPVAYDYADGQHWDDSYFDIPVDASYAVVVLYYQTSSREYMEFLRDTNTTNTLGQEAYDYWVAHGKSAPVDMDMMMLEFNAPLVGDVTSDGMVDIADLLALLAAWGPCDLKDACDCVADFDGNGFVDVSDLLEVLGNWGATG